VNQRRAKPISAVELSKLTTKRLLAYRNTLLELEDVRSLSDWVDHLRDPNYIWFKDDPKWAVIHGLVVAELSTREHIE
jgi:hypothetical protein